jgi:hypothetical protein
MTEEFMETLIWGQGDPGAAGDDVGDDGPGEGRRNDDADVARPPGDHSTRPAA